MEKPPEDKLAFTAQVKAGSETIIAFGLKGQEVAEYHYRFYQLLASLRADRILPEEIERYRGLIRDEIAGEVHGEVDEQSWRLKQPVVRKGFVRKESKSFADYVRQSFIDTLTLYLHGICCDIDVDTGPRQLPSRYLRKRLQLLQELFPAPEGYAVFPEDLKR